MVNPGPRSPAQRRRDSEHRLAHDVDVWVATASSESAPYLVPLSLDWTARPCCELMREGRWLVDTDPAPPTESHRA
jgi:hypothetical protein